MSPRVNWFLGGTIGASCETEGEESVVWKWRGWE